MAKKPKAEKRSKDKQSTLYGIQGIQSYKRVMKGGTVSPEDKRAGENFLAENPTLGQPGSRPLTKKYWR